MRPEDDLDQYAMARLAVVSDDHAVALDGWDGW